MSVGAQMVVVLKAFVERCVSLVLDHPFEFSWLDVSQTDVFHCSSPLGGSQQHSLARAGSFILLVTTVHVSPKRRDFRAFSANATPSAICSRFQSERS
jgi:hypothetical protein